MDMEVPAVDVLTITTGLVPIVVRGPVPFCVLVVNVAFPGAPAVTRLPAVP